MYAHRMVRDLFNHTEESLAELDRDAEKLRRCLKSLYESTWSTATTQYEFRTPKLASLQDFSRMIRKFGKTANAKLDMPEMTHKELKKEKHRIVLHQVRLRMRVACCYSSL
jgi:predicted transcriptional regulator